MSESLKQLKHDQHVHLATIRACQNQLRYPGAKRDELKSQLRAADDLLEDVNSRLAALVRKNNGLIISEHAIIRYLQRVRGVDIEQLKLEMASPKARKVITELGNCTVPVTNASGKTYKLRARGGVIVTTLVADRDQE